MIIEGIYFKNKRNPFIKTAEGLVYLVHDCNSSDQQQAKWHLSDRRPCMNTVSYKAEDISRYENKYIHGVFHQNVRYTTGGVGYILSESGEKVYVARVSETDGHEGDWAITNTFVYHDREDSITYYEVVYLG